MNEAQVWITGAGVHHALGDVAALAAALDADPPPAPAPAVGSVSVAPFLRGARRKLAKYMSPTTAMAVLAAGRALEAAGLLESLGDCALYVAADLIAFDLGEVSGALEASRAETGGLDLARLGRDGLRRCHPLMPFKMLLNMPLGLVSIVFGLRGENQIVYPGAGQAGVLLETALRGIHRGRLQRVLLGGTAHRTSLLPSCARERAGDGRPSTDAAAFVLLESEPAARERGAAARGAVRSVELGAPPVGAELSSGIDLPGALDMDRALGFTGAAALPLALAVALERGATTVAVGDEDGARVTVRLGEAVDR